MPVHRNTLPVGIAHFITCDQLRTYRQSVSMYNTYMYTVVFRGLCLKIFLDLEIYQKAFTFKTSPLAHYSSTLSDKSTHLAHSLSEILSATGTGSAYKT